MPCFIVPSILFLLPLQSLDLVRFDGLTVLKALYLQYLGLNLDMVMLGDLILLDTMYFMTLCSEMLGV